MEEKDVTKEEQATMMIDRLMDVRRAMKSEDKQKELENQEKVLIVKLEALGVTVSDLPEYV